MKILLVNIDSKLPNIALLKLERYYKAKGWKVDWFNYPTNREIKWEVGFWKTPVMDKKYDKTFVSCIFTKNKKNCEVWEGRAVIGGSGYDLRSELPTKIEKIKLKINYDFTTRGCVRKCPFCIVPEKEGKIKIIGDLLDVWDGKTKDVVLLDNNILALPNHFKKICKQAIKNKIRLNFNQGLDHRLLTEDIAKNLRAISHKEYYFSFDSLSYLGSVDKAIKLLRKHSINRSIWYILVGFDTSIEEDFARLNYIRDMGQTAYVMRYKKDKIYIAMARWANQHNIFRKMSWGDFISKKENRKYQKLYNKSGPNETNSLII